MRNLNNQLMNGKEENVNEKEENGNLIIQILYNREIIMIVLRIK